MPRGWLEFQGISCWVDGVKLAESGERVGRRGREGELLAVASEEGKWMGTKTPLRAFAGSGGEMSPCPTAPPPGDVLTRELPADDPAAARTGTGGGATVGRPKKYLHPI